MTADPIRPKVPSGARRMIHHSTRWMTLSSDSVKARNGSALRPPLSAAMPTTTAITMICRMLKFTEEVMAPPAAGSATLFTPMPRKFCGIRPSRKFHHVPTVCGAAFSRPVPACAPGWMVMPSTMPIDTAMKAVIANQSRVWPARRAAFCTRRRFEMLATIAVKTSGTTAARRIVTYEPPILSSVSDSTVCVSAVAPSWRPRRPAAMPRTSATMIWKPKEVSSLRTGPRVSGAFGRRAVGVVVLMETPSRCARTRRRGGARERRRMSSTLKRARYSTPVRDAG